MERINVETLRQPKVLIIDDDPDILGVLSSYLNNEGYITLIAFNGSDALSLFKTSEIHAVITDLDLPDMDGFEVMETIKSMEENTPVIVLTGQGTLDNAIKAIHSGAYDFVTKPLKKMSLLKIALDRALERRMLRYSEDLYNDEIEKHNKKLRQDLQAAVHIQQILMSTDFSELFEEIAVGSYYAPSLVISGCFFDILRLSADHALFYISEINASGVSAVMLTVLVKQVFSEIAESFYYTPEELIPGPEVFIRKCEKEIADRLIGLDEKQDKLDIVLGIFDFKTRELRLAAHGAQTRFCLIQDGGIVHLNDITLKTGKEHGGFDVLKLKSEDVCLFFNLGLLEAVNNAPNPYDLNILSSIVTEQPEKSVLNLTRDLKRRAEENYPDIPPSDVAFVALSLKTREQVA